MSKQAEEVIDLVMSNDPHREVEARLRQMKTGDRISLSNGRSIRCVRIPYGGSMRRAYFTPELGQHEGPIPRSGPGSNSFTHRNTKSTASEAALEAIGKPNNLNVGD